jgi:hypothetical protein
MMHTSVITTMTNRNNSSSSARYEPPPHLFMGVLMDPAPELDLHLGDPLEHVSFNHPASCYSTRRTNPHDMMTLFI